jgi:hypothetical protein
MNLNSLTPQLMSNGTAEWQSVEGQLVPVVACVCLQPSESGIVYAYFERSYVRPYIRLLLLLSLLSLITGFLPGSSLEPAVTPTTHTPVPHCSTFRIMCAVPSTAVCCSESVECFPGIASKFFL